MRKFLNVLMALALLLSLSLTAFAAGETPAAWQLSEDKETLSHDGRSYTWYPMAPGELLLPEEKYVYEVRLPALYDTYQLRVVTVPGNEDMVFLCEYPSDTAFTRVYVTEAGAEILDRYRQGDFSGWYLGDTQTATCPAAKIDASLAEALDDLSENAITEDAEVLVNLTRYEILGYDETETVVHVHGAVYLLDDSWYYLNYDKLDSSHFAVTGQFSYRCGPVELLPLDEALRGRIIGATGHLASRRASITYEEDESDMELDPAGAAAAFMVLSVILGFVIPAVPLVLSLCFAHSKKAVSPKRWYLLSALSCLWMLLAGFIIAVIVTS